MCRNRKLCRGRVSLGNVRDITVIAPGDAKRAAGVSRSAKILQSAGFALPSEPLINSRAIRSCDLGESSRNRNANALNARDAHVS